MHCLVLCCMAIRITCVRTICETLTYYTYDRRYTIVQADMHINYNTYLVLHQLNEIADIILELCANSDGSLGNVSDWILSLHMKRH